MLVAGVEMDAEAGAASEQLKRSARLENLDRGGTEKTRFQEKNAKEFTSSRWT